MSRINPEVLRNERDKKGWSLEKLESRSGVDRQSIHRIEKGGQQRNAHKVIKALARAMGITEEVLTGEIATSVPEKKMAESDEAFSESQLSLRVSDGARNALALTAQRYRVSHAQIVEIAPLLFFWVAEMSLRARRNKLDTIQKKYEEISQAAEAFSHLQFHTLDHDSNGEPIEAEDKSIEKRDIFGTTIGDYGSESHIPRNYDEPKHNPMTMFLKELVSEFSEAAEFGSWFPDSSPQYSICKKEVLDFVGGDEGAATYIHSGRAPLRKLPKELSENGKEVQRAEWVREQGKHWLDSFL